MDEILTRKTVPAERKWMPSDILSENDIEKMVEDVQEGILQISSFEGKLNKENALECLLLNSRVCLILEKLVVYAHLKWDEDKSNTKYADLSERFSMLCTQFDTAVAFIDPAFSAMKQSDIEDMIKNPDFEYYTMFLRAIQRNKKHLLSAKEETILSKVYSFAGDFRTIFSQFDNVNIPFGTVPIDGKKVKLTHGLYAVCMNSSDRNVRKHAYETLYKAYRSNIETISYAYVGSVKKDCFYASVRKHKSSLAMALFAENIPTKVYDNLISSVHKYVPVLHRYMTYRKKELGLPKLAMYDIYVPIVEGVEKLTDYDESFRMVKEALQPLGREYGALLQEAKTKGWIDVEETKNKRNGAYSTCVYDTHPYVLLNHKGTMHDVFTIAHELGHALHSYYSNRSQCYEKASYSIFVAEIASTVNEVLMIKHLLKTAQGNTKKYLLSYYADMIRTTLFRQTMFSEFEKFSHETIEKNEPLSFTKMCDFYGKLNEFYYGKDVETDENITYEWVRIPHFYSAFYVYKYATGITCAINIANMILSDPSKVDDYKKFLSAGGSLYPLDTIKLVGIDLCKRDPYDVAMKEFSDVITELENTKSY